MGEKQEAAPVARRRAGSLEEQLRHRARGLATLLEVSRGLAATLDLGRVLQATTDGAARLFGLDTAAVYLLEEDALRLWATTPPLPPGFPEDLRAARLADHPRVREAIASGRALHVPDLAAVDLTAAERSVVEQRNLRTVLYLPLVAGERSVGALIVGSVGAPREVSQAEVELCLTLANLAALAVENARLFLSVQEHAAELERTLVGRERAERERLELERRLLHAQKLESLGVLAGGIAHDFNNLLQAILGNLDVALAQLPPGCAGRGDVERSTRAARRASDLTRQLLAYSGKGRFEVARLDLSAVVAEHAELLRSGVTRSATLELRLARSLPAIEADAGQVQQVVLNLITNAAEAIGDRQGVITVATGAGEFDREGLARDRTGEAPPPGRYVFLEVSDTGCGMDDSTLERLFDPFYTTKAAGRGLGMSALLGIVRGHRGAILVESAAGRGTTTRVLFPALGGAPPEPAPRPDAAAPAQGPPQGEAVLVVDDEDMVRDVCRRMVECLGMEAFAASGGREAIEVLRGNLDRISWVLLDLTMPGMDGVAAFRELVAVKPALKVILCSGYNEQDAVRQLSGEGLAGFVQKPYDIARLRAAFEGAGRAGS